MSKLELFLKHLDPAKVIDRGSGPVQGVEELKSLRDRYVHPRIRKAVWTERGENVKTVDLGNSPVLGLPYDVRSWGPTAARVTICAVTEFFNYFFLDLCALSPNQTCEILFGDGDIDLARPGIYKIDGTGELARAVQEWGASFRFIGE